MPEPDPETRLLLGALATQREHVLGIVDGLSDEELSRPVLPSGWTCLGLVQHLTLDVERFWFREVVAGEVLTPVDGTGGSASAWEVPPGLPAGAVLAGYRREMVLADGVIAGTALATPPAHWPEELFGQWRLADLREVLMHVITETACHAGHLDAVRELIDGRTWLVMT